MKKVLVPCDGSESARRALQYVLDLPAPSRPDEIHLLNVQAWPVIVSEYVTADVIDLLREGQLKSARELLASVASLASAARIPRQTHALMGLVEDTIVQQAEQLGCDHIIMGTRGMGALKGLVVGSVATKVLHLAKTPVTFVK